MPQILASKNPRVFKTQPLQVEASSRGLTYRPIGLPLNFSQMQALRQPVQIEDNEEFSLRVANLGVSVRLSLQWQGRDYWVLVRQRRADRGDCVLKLISGYVPVQELNLPLLTALQEISEECLVATPSGWLCGRYGEHWLQQPYQDCLDYQDDSHFRLSPRCGATRPVAAGNLPLLERPRAYIHLPTASLQLVYDLHLELPEGVDSISLLHVDEQLEEQKLVARLGDQGSELFLLPQHNPEGELFTLEDGQLVPCCTEDLWLSESFAPQEGWLVRASRISWQDWLSSQRVH